MSRDKGFWRNAAIAAVIHAMILAGLAHWSGSAAPPAIANVVWMDPSALSASATDPPQVALLAQENSASEPAPAAESAVTPMEDPLTMRTPPPTEEATPAPTPKTSPSRKPSPKPSATVAAKVKAQKKAKTVVAKPKSSRSVNEGRDKTPARGPSSVGTQTGTPASGIDAGWYNDMLHDRFHRAWEQPTSVVGGGAKLSAPVHLRIESDGRVSEFKLLRSSGNVVVDESIQAVASRVTRVDPPPPGLLNGSACELNVTFDWNAKQ